AGRAAALERLSRQEINCIFAVDLFNEGLDLPQVDTILMLRPTQSATIFLQQLGRGCAVRRVKRC
ncbi:helicase-related protein, partial [Arthrobacter sp. Hiyo1]|uniref:helicase-related protein n=1 Tax=Arthrobacter sp. Hiyo1 TaxID=1588020 RepID=UPI000AA48510